MSQKFYTNFQCQLMRLLENLTTKLAKEALQILVCSVLFSLFLSVCYYGGLFVLMPLLFYVYCTHFSDCKYNYWPYYDLLLYCELLSRYVAN